MTIIRKLKDHPYAQCWVIDDDSHLILRSYNTDVIIFNPFTGVLICTGLYSMTTRRHISNFLKECLPTVDYKTVKKIAGNDLEYNVYTGEVK
jgi:hypothetical protein